MAPPPTTSLQRTYRYLRLAQAGVVAAIFVAVAVAIPAVGLLPSLSHYFYSPARTVFVGALLAGSVCLLALSGRGAERALLDAAALMLPLVAIVPTVVSVEMTPDLAGACPRGCVPASVLPDVDNGVLTYLVVGAGILVLAAALAAAGQVARAVWGSIAVSATVLLAVGLAWTLARDAFLRWGHLVAAAVFFALIAAVALVNAFSPRSGSPRRFRVAYAVIAVALLADVAGIPFYGDVRVGAVWGVLGGETVALLLFLAFWILQSVENWNDRDPASLRASS